MGMVVGLIKGLGTFGLGKKAGKKTPLNLSIKIGGGKNPFSRHFAIRVPLLSQEHCTCSAIAEQFFEYARAEHFANEMLSPGYGHTKAPLYVLPTIIGEQAQNLEYKAASMKQSRRITGESYSRSFYE